MYLKKVYNSKTKRTYLSIAQKYRHPIKKVSTDRNVKSLGYLDELEKKWVIDKKFKPVMDKKSRDILYSNWKKAVKRSFSWEKMIKSSI